MDHIVNRESAEMHFFSTEAFEIANDLENVCSHLKHELYDANGYMQDRSGQDAITIVSELVEETLLAVNYIRTLADKIKKSAVLLEESDDLL